MARNRTLTLAELARVNDLLATIRSALVALSNGDPNMHFAYRRKVYKELTYDERSKPAVRRALKAKKYKAQQGRCALCTQPMPQPGSVLDRFHAPAGYTDANTRLICPPCDTATQAGRGSA